MRSIGIPLLIASLAGCGWDEGLEIHDMTGTILVPRAAATRVVTNSEGVSEEVTDVALIGPVYLGFYPSVREGLLSYPHPEMGPVYQSDVQGDTYPYGGTSVGDFRFACVEFLACKVASGRHVDFDSLVTWFNERVGEQITDSEGRPVTNGDYLRQECYDLLNYTSDAEIRLTAYEDRNDDGAIDEKDLDFVENADGDFEAEFTVFQQEYFQDEESGQGFSLWGWMDAPSADSYTFSTCDPSSGQSEREYTSQFEAGRPYPDLLNFPDNYMASGDWVASMEGTHVYESPTDTPTIVIDFQVVE